MVMRMPMMHEKEAMMRRTSLGRPDSLDSSRLRSPHRRKKDPTSTRTLKVLILLVPSLDYL